MNNACKGLLEGAVSWVIICEFTSVRIMLYCYFRPVHSNNSLAGTRSLLSHDEGEPCGRASINNISLMEIRIP